MELLKKDFFKKTLNSWIDEEMDITVFGCIGMLYEPQRPISNESNAEKVAK